MYVKCTLKGEPACIVLKLKERGIMRSSQEVVVQGFLAFYEEVTEQDLRTAQARTRRRFEEEA